MKDKTAIKSEKLNEVKSDLTSTVLKLINKGLYAKQIADKLGITKARVSQIIKNLEKTDYLHEKYRDAYKVYGLTEKGKTAIKSEKLSKFPYGMDGEVKRELHDLYIKIPIMNPEALNGLPKDFWDKINDKIPNGIRRYKFLKKPFGITWTLNQGEKTISIQAHSVPVKDSNEIYSIVNRMSFYTCEFFRKHGIHLDFLQPSVRNIHITRSDDDSRELAGQGKKFKIFLKRNRAKFFKGDPDQRAYVELDRTPEDNWETNDREHDELRALMPEYVYGIVESMQVFSKGMQEHMILIKSLQEVADNQNSQINIFGKVAKKLLHLLSQRTLKEFR